jgi:hypothetical protein
VDSLPDIQARRTDGRAIAGGGAYLGNAISFFRNNVRTRGEGKLIYSEEVFNGTGSWLGQPQGQVEVLLSVSA